MLQRSDHPEPGLHLCSGDPAGHPVQGHRGPEGDQRLKDRYISIFAVVVVSAPNKGHKLLCMNGCLWQTVVEPTKAAE